MSELLEDTILVSVGMVLGIAITLLRVIYLLRNDK